MSYRINWDRKYYLKNNEDFNNFYDILKELKPSIMSIDTETTGLHIILNEAFFVSVAYANDQTNLGVSAGIDLRFEGNKERLKNLLYFSIQRVKKVPFFNAKFDLSMLFNIGIDLVNSKKITDVSYYARLSLKALSKNKGGPVLKLKVLAQKYIDPDANVYQNRITMAKKALKEERTKILKSQGIKIKELDEFLKDKLNELEDLPKDVLDILTDDTLDPEKYYNIPKETLAEYGVYDAIFTLELFLLFNPIVISRSQQKIVQLENDLIPVLWKIERYGFSVNEEYLLQAKEEMKTYIKRMRDELLELTDGIKASQSVRLIKVFKEKYGLRVNSTDKHVIEDLMSHENPVVVRMAELISDLRTAEKWYSTYLLKNQKYANLTNKIYTSFNQAGAVSGRFSSDFQQFPSSALEYFNPRKMIVPSENYRLLLMDFSSEELRFQAIYTCLLNEPDLNLCRAFVPFNCYKIENGEKIDYKLYNKDFSKDKWFKKESDEEWSTQDLHATTTLLAFPWLTTDHPEFKKYRKLGKTTNFSCNYGGSAKTLASQCRINLEIATKLRNAYNEAFKGVANYRRHVANILRQQDYITNLYGRRYYHTSAHEGGNFLVQGSAADYLKIKLIEIDKFLTEGAYKTRILGTIHDEIIYELWKGEEHIIPKLKDIMENIGNSPIPMVSDVEISDKTWADKGKYTL